MSTKIGAPNSLLNTASTSLSQALDKWLPGGVRPVFSKTVVIPTATLVAGGTVTLIPDPGAGNAILLKDYRVTITDTPATNAGPANDGSGGLAISAGGVINGVSGFSATGMTTGGTAGVAYTAYGGVGTAAIRYHGGTSISGAAAITNAFLQSAAVPATMNGPIAAAILPTYGGANGAVEWLPSRAFNDVQAIVANIVIVLNYEIISMRT